MSSSLKSLDQSIVELEALVRSLEDPNLSIDDAIAKYAEGMNLAIECRKSMNEMTRKVNEVRQQAMNQLNSTTDNN